MNYQVIEHQHILPCFAIKTYRFFGGKQLYCNHKLVFCAQTKIPEA